MGVVISVKVELAEMNCGRCGGTYAINEAYREKQQQCGGSWNCPYCMVGWGYANNSDNAELKRELEKEKKRRKWAEDSAAARSKELNQVSKKLSAQKGVTTRLKNRAKAGVCPCCNRTFKQLADHMKNKHPDFDPKQ